MAGDPDGSEVLNRISSDDPDVKMPPVDSKKKPLTAEETSSYVQHRLSVAGGGSAVTFAPKALARVHRYTAGIPRLINLLCDRALLSAYSAHATRVSPQFVDGAAESLELEGPQRTLRAWVRQRIAGFAAGMTFAAVLSAGAAAMWHYREYATLLMQLVANRQ